MKCPTCNNELSLKEVGGKQYLVCSNCKKSYDLSDLMNMDMNGQGSGRSDEIEKPPIVLSVISMILGIIGLLLSCLGIGIFPAVVGFALAIVALAVHHSKGMAIAGLVTSLIGIIIAAVILVTGTAVNSVLEERGFKSFEKTEKDAVDKDKDKSQQDGEDPAPEPEQPADDNMIDFNTGKYIIKYTGHAVGTDYEGKPCLIVYYDFTNNSDENTSSAASVFMKAFQNGVQCDTAIFTEENEALGNYMTEIQPGTTINTAQCYSIPDMSQVTLEASELITLDDTKDTMVIQLQ